MPGFGGGGNEFAKSPVSSSSSGIITTLAPVPSWYPLFWADTTDIDGAGNSTLTLGSNVASIVNKGTFLNAGAQVPFVRRAGTATYEAATPGSMGNLPVIHSTDGAAYFDTGAIPALPTVFTMAILFRVTNPASAVNVGLCDGLGASRSGLFTHFPDGAVSMVGSGGATFATGQLVKGQTWHSVIGVFNGASSFTVIDGVASGFVSPTPVALTGLTLMALIGGFGVTDSRMAEFHYIGDVATSPATINAYFAAKWGVTPQ